MQLADWERLIDEDPDEAGRQAALILDKEPDNPLALFVIATVYSRAERFGVSANLFQRICQIAPDRQEAWNNLGMCFSGMGQLLKARRCFEQAWKLQEASLFAANIGMTYFAERDFKNAQKWCHIALKKDPESASARTTLGMTKLSLGEWSDGWELYAASVGGKFRKNIQYGEEPMWDGVPGKVVVFYGEQGLGDEIQYSSCVPDAVKTCSEVILDCDKRLVGLFKRSFPGAKVYGTRTQNEVAWLSDHKPEARLPVGQMPQFFRKSPKDCSGAPFLKADPERRVQWRALFDSWGKKPKIGVAWSGGSKHNAPHARNVGLEGLRSILESIDADWISLQYKDPTEEIASSGLNVRHFKRACETDDYDDTAAMVAELDMVISVPTAVVHLAGSLGVETDCLTPHESDWTFYSGLPWYSTVRLFWKGKDEQWNDCIRRYLESVHRLRPEATSGVQRPPALDYSALVSPGKHHPPGALSATAQAARAY